MFFFLQTRVQPKWKTDYTREDEEGAPTWPGQHAPDLSNGLQEASSGD